jgi:hypothetical protein
MDGSGTVEAGSMNDMVKSPFYKTWWFWLAVVSWTVIELLQRTDW